MVIDVIQSAERVRRRLRDRESAADSPTTDHEPDLDSRSSLHFARLLLVTFL
jgi:hypothetical protein